MTLLDLDSLGQNNQPSDWTFYQSIATFNQAIALLSKLLPLFRQMISSHRSTKSIATLFQAIAFVSWPTSPSDCLDCQAIAHPIQAIA